MIEKPNLHRPDAATELDGNSRARPASEPVAIIGIGCMFPKAPDLEAFWSNIRGGVDAISSPPDTHWDPADYYDADPSAPDKTYGRRGGFLDTIEFNPLEYGISPRDLEATDTSQLLGLAAAKRALSDAGYPADAESLARDRISVLLGVTGTLELVIPLGARLGHPRWRRALAEAGVDAETAEDVCARIGESYVGWQENSFPGLLGNVVAGRIANRLDLHGTNCVVDAACASSLSALHLSLLELQAGRSDMVVTGGVDTFNDIFMYMCFSKTPALSPTGDARPFAETGDGTILGEGVGMMVLKRLRDAERDGDRIYAVIRGMGSASDGKGDAVYAPSAAGQARALRNAYENAGVGPETIELVEAHGTGTKVGDATEIRGLTSVYSEADRDGSWCALGSVKSMIGHTKAAAGAAGVIKAAMALYKKILPPTIKVDRPNEAAAPGTTPFYVNTEPRPWIAPQHHPRRAGVSAFGFGGSNFHCVLEEHEGSEAEIDWDGRVQILACSAADRGEIRVRLLELAASIETAGGTWADVRGIAASSRSRFEGTAHARLVLVVEVEGVPAAQQIAEAVELLDRDPDASHFSTPRGIHFATGAAQGSVGAVFPGQGSQYAGMLRDLVCTFPAALDVFTDAHQTMTARPRSDASPALADLVFPHPAFDDAERGRQSDALRDTRVAQPAIGAVSLGAFRILEGFGVEFASATGHSYGELTALCAAGRIEESDFHRLSNLRGELMAQSLGSDGGAMLAVVASREEVEDFLAKHRLDLVVANRNGPRQVVLSGPTETIARAAMQLEQQEVRATRLPVAAAFHSPLVAAASTPFGEALADVPFATPRFPVFANSTGAEYANDAASARQLLAGQLAAPVEFQRAIENMRAAGTTTFVEVGPSRTLTGLVGSILADDDAAAAIAIDPSRSREGSGTGDLARVLACLAARGHAVDLTRWDPGFLAIHESAAARKKPAFTVPLNGANYSVPRDPRPAVKRDPAPPARPAATSPTPPTSPFATTPPVPVPQISVPHVPVPKAPIPHAVPAASPTPPPRAPEFQSMSTRANQESLQALIRMHEQTADLHQRFLEAQQQVANGFQALIAAQGHGGAQGMTPPQSAVMGTEPAVAPTPVVPAEIASPAPTPQAAPQGTPPDPRPSPAPSSAPAVVPPPSEPAKASVRSLSASTHVAEVLMHVVAEKTGYPAEMLELSMGLDADLGIDSIKRVEILSSLQERLPHAPVVKPEHLGELQTLGQIAEFLSEADNAEGDNAEGDRAESANAESASHGIEGPVPATGTATPAATNPEGLSRGGAEDTRTSLTATLLEIVAAKTGYPAEMLELSMGLDADLGIDSIKRVEILSSLQERLPHAPVVKPEHLGDLSTLGQIVDFLAAGESSASTGTEAHVGSSSSPSEAVAVDHSRVPVDNREPFTRALLHIVADKTGYPAEMLELSMGLDADLGIDSIKRVEILSALQEQLPHAPAVKPEHLGELQTLGQIVDFLCDGEDAAPTETPSTPPRVEEAAPTITRSVLGFRRSSSPTEVTSPLRPEAFVWVTRTTDGLSRAVVDRFRALGVKAQEIERTLTAEPPADLAGLVFITPENPPADFLHQCFGLTRHVGRTLRATAEEQPALFATVSRMDGCFGLSELPLDAPVLSGGLAGLTKTVGHEWPRVQATALDIHADESDLPWLAERIVGRILSGTNGEYGIDRQGTSVLELQARDLPARSAPDSTSLFREEDVIVITGGARGVTAEVAIALARTSAPRLALLGRSPAPTPEPGWLRDLEDETSIKQAILARATEKDPAARLTPKELSAEFDRIHRNREVLRNIARMEESGSRVDYATVDVRDASCLQSCLAELTDRLGPITGVIHGAGVLADSYIADKSDEDFARVLGTKVDGFANLLTALAEHPLRAIVTFSSSTARFGRTGQADYAVANEVINKMAQREQRRRPECRVLSTNWGPWDGGMVTPALRDMFQGEGISVIDLSTGADYLIDELSQPAGPVEVVILGGGSILPDGVPETMPDADQGTTDATASDTDAEPVETIPSLAAIPELPTVFERELSVANHEFLRSHVMDGKAVVPVALILEWVSHGALHGNPGLRFCGIDDLRIFKGVLLDEADTAQIRICAARAEKSEGTFSVATELWSTDPDGRRTLHARATARLSNQLETTPEAAPPAVHSPYETSVTDAYGSELFHGAALRGLTQVDGCDERGIVALSNVAPPPRDWIEQPLRSRWITDPLALDASFQLMILWSRRIRGVASLPTEFRRYRQFRSTFPRDGVRIEVRVTGVEPNRALADIDWLDTQGVVIACMQGYQCVLDASLADAFRRNVLDNRSAARR